MMEHLNNDRRRKLHILSDLKGFILFVLDENSKKKNKNWAFWNSVRGKYSTDCLENVREKYVEQKNPMQNLLEKVMK